MRSICLAVAALLPFAVAAQTKSIFLVTDAEGVAGVCRQDQTDPKDAEMRQLLTGEINAAVDGLFRGGATDVVVWDGHDGSQTLSTLTIDPRAKLLMGDPGLSMTFDRHYAAMGFIGQHARANTRGGVMAHSFSSLGIQNMLVNGKPSGEIEAVAALAGWFRTPVILLSGDQAAADQIHAIVPGAEVAVVKEGLANYACISLSAESARALIHSKAEASMKKLDSIAPYRIDGPVTIEIEHTSRSALTASAGSGPGEEVVDARTIRYHGANYFEAWTRWKGR